MKAIAHPRLRQNHREQMARAVALVSRRKPYGKLRPRTSYTLPMHKLDPVIRIAHRSSGAVNVPERIIFDHELVLFLAGEGTLEFEGKRIDFAAHQLLFVPPFQPHTFTSSDRCDHVAVHFDMAPGFPVFSRDPSRRSPYEMRLSHGLAIATRITLSPADGIEEQLLAIVHATHNNSPLAELEMKTSLLRVLLALLKTAPLDDSPVSMQGDARNRMRIERAAKFIAENFARPLTAEKLAEVSGLSHSHFARLFRAWSGYSPMEYLRHIRVARARQLLADVDLSIKEIAARSGFEDSYHFSKVFRQLDGLPPSAYREAILAAVRR